ncbi:F-box domain-containing protein [Artemisia annua]|uniref:F-box domain-containing protein n=1 Tax=Artemisia annua TaxID=35608 RepID=A0A2U1MUS8_ARTAN|nr:F-box domain-containing protein [Artemisia annua]
MLRMAKTRSMTREQKRLKTSEEGGSASWSDLFGDLLIIVMMRLGLVDFVSFSGVWKRWRSIAHSQWKTFMGSVAELGFQNRVCTFARMVLEGYAPYVFYTTRRILGRGFWLEDFEGRRFKTIRRHGTHRTCIGSTRGYLIMFGRLTSDFWLVNPITRHEFHFTDFPWPQITHHPANFREKTIGQYAFYFNGMCTSAAATAIKPNTEAHGGGRTQSKILCFRSADQSRKEGGLRTIASSMWYFPQDCLNVKLAPMGEMED